MQSSKDTRTKTELIQYLHECCFSPTPRTFLKEIKNRRFLTWPCLKNKHFLKHPPPSIATALGHLDQERENLQSTKQVKLESEIEEDNNFYPKKEAVKTHELCATIIPFNKKIKGFRDLTGTSPHKSTRGNFYVMIMYDYDSNAILSKPIKNRQAATIHDALLKIY